MFSFVISSMFLYYEVLPHPRIIYIYIDPYILLVSSGFIFYVKFFKPLVMYFIVQFDLRMQWFLLKQ